MVVLITGFESFQNVEFNPSEFVVEHLAEHVDHPIVTRVLPVEYEGAARRICHLIDRHQPEAVLMLGVASSRQAINLERIALNIDDARSSDNSGECRQGEHIVPGAPLAYESTLPLVPMRSAVADAGIPVRISNHAGAYVCNHVFFVARHHIALRGDSTPCGFIHLPAVGDPDQGVTLSDMLRAVACCLDVVRARSQTQVA